MKLLQGDCLELMKDIKDKSINMILCDLPYGSTVNGWDVVIPFERLWEQYERIISNKGNIVLFGGGLFAYRLALSNTKLYRYDMIWQKSKCGSPLTAKYMPMKKHELLLVFGKSGAYYDPQMVEGVPYARIQKQKVNNMGYGTKDGYLRGSKDGKRYPSTILNFSQKWRRQDQIHPTQKPVDLCEWLIKSFCPIDGVVLDNCMGSGTTGVACKNINRDFVGMELDEKYFEIAKNRIEQIK